MKQYTVEEDQQQRTVKENVLTKRQLLRGEDEDYTVKTVYTAKQNNITIRCTICNHLKFKLFVFVFVLMSGGMSIFQPFSLVLKVVVMTS